MRILDRLNDDQQRRCEQRARRVSGLAVDDVPTAPAQLRLEYHAGQRAARASGRLHEFAKSPLAVAHERLIELDKSSACSCQPSPMTLDTTTTTRVLAVEGQRASDGTILSKDRVFRWALAFAELGKPIPVFDSARRKLGELVRIDDGFNAKGKLELTGHFKGLRRDMDNAPGRLCFEEHRGRLVAIHAK
jgi:hypothetical protein